MSDIAAATVQFNHRSGDKPYNLGRIEHYVQIAAGRRVNMLIFPEMCITGYWHVRHLSRGGIVELAEPVPDGPSTRAIRSLAVKHGMLIGAGLIELTDDGHLFNTYICCLPDGTVHRHRKLHCFISDYFSSGDSYTVFGTPFGCKAGVLICWDNNLVENVRITALKGADILIAPHQTGGCRSRSPYAMGPIDVTLWENRHQHPESLLAECRGPKGREWLMRWLPARAHDNGLFILFANGVGRDDDEVRTGNAMIIDPYGRIISESETFEDDMVTASLDLDLLPTCTGRRWIRGRRPELYKPLILSTGRELDPRSARFSDQPVL